MNKLGTLGKNGKTTCRHVSIHVGRQTLKPPRWVVSAVSRTGQSLAAQVSPLLLFPIFVCFLFSQNCPCICLFLHHDEFQVRWVADLLLDRLLPNSRRNTACARTEKGTGLYVSGSAQFDTWTRGLLFLAQQYTVGYVQPKSRMIQHICKPTTVTIYIRLCFCFVSFIYLLYIGTAPRGPHSTKPLKQL